MKTSQGKIFAFPNSPRCPIKTLKKYIPLSSQSHLAALFQRPKSLSSQNFSPRLSQIWYDRSPLEESTLGSTLRNMSIQVGITPHLTSHCIRATLITVLCEARFEGKDIRSITGHKSNTSLESYTGSASFGKHVEMAENLANFVDKENIHSASCTNMENMILAMPQTTPDQQIPQSTLQSWPSKIAENTLYLRSSGLTAPVSNFHGCSVQINFNMNPTIN